MQINITVNVPEIGAPEVQVDTSSEAEVLDESPASTEIEVLESLAGSGKLYASAQLRRYPGGVHVQLNAPGVPGGNRSYGYSITLAAPERFLDLLDSITGVQS